MKICTINDSFIHDFIISYPKLFIRILSYNLAFTEENLQQFGFLLSWDKYGILGNSNIKWTPILKSTFSKRLVNKEYSPPAQEYISLDLGEIKPIKLRVDYLTGQKKYYLNPMEVNLENIRKYRDAILGWGELSLHFSEITYEFIMEFKEKINFDLLLRNQTIDWSDLRLFKFYVVGYKIIMCENLWINYIKKYSANYRLRDHLVLFNNLDKFVKIHWKSEELGKDGTTKYLLSVYAKSESGHQIMTSGYYRTNKNYEKGMTFELGKNYKFPISNKYIFR